MEIDIGGNGEQFFYDDLLVEQNKIIAEVLGSRNLRIRKYKWDEYEAM